MRTEKSLIEMIKKPAGEVVIDAADLGLDEIIDRVVDDSDIIKDMPFVKWVVLGKKITSNIHLAFFIKKYSAFIGPITQNVGPTFWDDCDQLIGDHKKFKTLIEQTFIAIDRYQAVDKAKILGLLFVKTFKDRMFSIDEYNTLLFSIELMHPYSGVKCLKQFYDYKVKINSVKERNEEEQVWREGSNIDFSPLASTCLLRLPTGGSYAGDLGGAFINDLGAKFYEEVVGKVMQ